MFRKTPLTVMLLLSLASPAFSSNAGIFHVYEPDRLDSKTASGEDFGKDKLTVAHRNLPFGTKLQLSRDGKIVVNAVVNDRINGNGDIFACTPGVAEELGFGDIGIAEVNWTVTEQSDGKTLWENPGGSNWYSVKNVGGSDLFQLYNALAAGGYKMKYENGTLTMLHISSALLPNVRKDLEKLGADISAVKVSKEEQTPLRT